MMSRFSVRLVVQSQGGRQYPAEHRQQAETSESSFVGGVLGVSIVESTPRDDAQDPRIRKLRS